MGKTNRIIKKIALGGGRFLPDKLYISIRYYLTFKRRMHWRKPETYTEKVQWMKVNVRDDAMTMLVDKYAVRNYIKEQIGAQYLIPLLGVWDSYDEIDFDKLPKQFVLKCNHDSGSVLIVKDKSAFDRRKGKAHFQYYLNRSQFYGGREWPYKNVPRKIVAEQYMLDESGTGLNDYKFFCFSGEPKFLFVATERMTEGEDVKFDFFDLNFKHLPFKNGHEWNKQAINKPENFDLMVSIARKLAGKWPQVRIDLYNINGRIYFGEITFSHHCGFEKFTPDEWDFKIGELVKLPK